MFGGSVCASADLLPPAGEGWLSFAAVRDGNARPLGKPPARGSLGYIQLLFSLPLARWLMGLLQRADEGIGPYGMRKAIGYFVGADALIRPPVQAAATAWAARSGCAAVCGFAAYGCGIPLAGTARSLFVKNKKRTVGRGAQPSAWLFSRVQWDAPKHPATPPQDEPAIKMRRIRRRTSFSVQSAPVSRPRITMVMAPSRTAALVLQVRVNAVSSGTTARKELEPETLALASATRS